MRIFQNKWFRRFARRVRVTDADLRRAVSEINRGLVDADLGGGVIKQRVARRAGGKSGGFRVLVLVEAGEKAFFVLGFAKSDRDNIREDELRALRRLADVYFGYDDNKLMRAIEAGELIEVGVQSKRARK